METPGSRLRGLRESVKLPQTKIAEMIGTVQSTIVRYETDKADAPYKVLVWYADYFDVSLDYILCRTDQPQGKLYSYEPQALKERIAKEEDWKEFIEMCFDPRSSVSAKLKEMMLSMGGVKEE
ncbi:MAG: helix-turn-helix transcriptional regulator [Christensenella sp.]|uniref:helix-turn-helix domain-containing protein n=1 Tax=Christensenella sp. TaxID=1935934 RepID=UPI002B1F7AF7|nr:helix-turn-helix transcriptional regulator [Christensenella sp.]MEA5002041.1 helix-turn-helix transcriptional regulator [Christensenella sp.]